MSQTLELRIPNKKIPHKNLVEILLFLGYKQWQSKNDYIFYEQTDFLSFGAIHLSIQLYKNGIKIRTDSGGLRNKFDIDKQNETIRTLKKQFWGYVYNDWTPWTYIQWWENKDYTQLERACGLAYHKFQLNCMRAMVIGNDAGISMWDADMPLIYLQMTKEWNYWNLIIPFLISITEDFLKTFFVRYLQYSQDLNIDKSEKIEKHFTVWEIIQIANKEKNFSEIIASRYNFQNISDIKKAYKQYLKLNLEWIWKDNITLLQEIIEKRHKIIHEAEFYILTKEQIWTYTECIRSIWKALIEFIEKWDWIRLDFNQQ